MFKVLLATTALLLLGTAHGASVKVTTTAACTAQQVQVPTNLGLDLNTSTGVWVPSAGFTSVQALYDCGANPAVAGTTRDRELQTAGFLAWLVLVCNRNPFGAIPAGQPATPSLCSGSLIVNANTAAFHKQLSTVEFLVTLTPTLTTITPPGGIAVQLPSGLTASNPIIVTGTYKWANARKLVSALALTFSRVTAPTTPFVLATWSWRITITYAKPYYPIASL